MLLDWIFEDSVSCHNTRHKDIHRNDTQHIGCIANSISISLMLYRLPTFSVILCHYGEPHNVDMLTFIMLNDIILSVHMLNVHMLSVHMLSVHMLSVDMLSVDMLSVNILNVIMPSVDMLNIIMSLC